MTLEICIPSEPPSPSPGIGHLSLRNQLVLKIERLWVFVYISELWFNESWCIFLKTSSSSSKHPMIKAMVQDHTAMVQDHRICETGKRHVAPHGANSARRATVLFAIGF